MEITMTRYLLVSYLAAASLSSSTKGGIGTPIIAEAFVPPTMSSRSGQQKTFQHRRLSTSSSTTTALPMSTKSYAAQSAARRSNTPRLMQQHRRRVLKQQRQRRHSLVLQSMVAESNDATASDAFPTAFPSSSSSKKPNINIDLKLYPNVHEFNVELDSVARQCLDDDPSQSIDVIGCATLAESMLHALEHHAAERAEEERLARENDVVLPPELFYMDGEGPMAAPAVEEHHNGDAEAATGHRKRVMRPDVISYNTAIKAWAKTAASLAEGRGRGTAQTNLGIDTPDISVYTARDAAERAQHLLDDLEYNFVIGKSRVQPDSTSYNAAIDAWAKSRTPDSAERAEAILRRMESLSTNGASLSDGNVDEERAEKERWRRVSPDTVTYNAVIEAWSHSPDPKGLDKAIELLTLMEEAYESSGRARLKPNIRTVNNVINAYAKRGASNSRREMESKMSDAWDYAKKSQKLLERSLAKYEETKDVDYKPDVTTYTSVIDAYARCGDIHATERAEELMKQMWKRYEETGDKSVRPNYRTYTALIMAWSKTRDPRTPTRAEELLEEMEKGHKEDLAKLNDESGDKILREESRKPNKITYTAVINSWARSRDPNKAVRSLRIVKRMNDLYKETKDESVRPNLFSFNSAIDACAKCRGTFEQQTQALKIAFAINKAIDAAEGMSPNHVTYGTLLKAVGNLMPAGKERNDVAKAVFEKCKKAGMVEPVVVKHLQMASDREVFDEMLATAIDHHGHVDHKKIPHLWSKNVR